MPGKSSLRVLSGKFKGTSLLSPGSELTHPMGAREKLALFNMVQPYLEEAKVLDIYAGSGALGIEALSRGAKSVVFVEKSAKIASVIRQNLAKITGKTQILTENARDFASNDTWKGQFEVILADPPYDGFSKNEVVELPKLLQPGGILALSFPFAGGVPEISEVKLLTVRKYAAAGIAIYQKI